MAGSLRVVLADDDPDTREMYSLMLLSLGHDVVGIAADGKELVTLCGRVKPDLIIVDIAMPGMDGLEAADVICKTEPVALMVVSGRYDEKLVERAQLNHILAYLVKPITVSDLQASIAVVMARFKELTSVRAEAATLRQALKDRKVIERAKGLVMARTGVCEDDAFRRLQKLACDKNEKLVRIAEMIVMAEGAVAPFQPRVNPPSSVKNPDTESN